MAGPMDRGCDEGGTDARQRYNLVMDPSSVARRRQEVFSRVEHEASRTGRLFKTQRDHPELIGGRPYEQ